MIHGGPLLGLLALYMMGSLAADKSLSFRYVLLMRFQRLLLCESIIAMWEGVAVNVSPLCLVIDTPVAMGCTLLRTG